jgi:SH3-like domain-containing protein
MNKYILLFVITITYSLFSIPIYAADCGLVTTSNTALNIRQRATRSSRIIYKASKGSALSILSTRGSYYKIKLNNGKIAYANRNYITRSNDCGIVNISSGKLNVRSSRRTSSKIISRISRNSAVSILKSYRSWYRVKLNSGKIGYVSSKYIKSGMAGKSKEIKFKRGSSSNIIEGAVVRGTTNEHFLKAGAGQVMEVKISSFTNNAVFDLAIYKNSRGKYVTLKNEAKSWYGELPYPGWSRNGKTNVVKITIGSTRGNADYTMSITIKNYDWKD